MRPSAQSGMRGSVTTTKEVLFYPKQLITRTAVVHGVALSPDGATFASSPEDSSIKLWDTGTGKMLRVFLGHTDIVSCMAFSPKSATLASGSRDCTIRIWDIDIGKLLRNVRCHISSLNNIAYTPDGVTLAYYDADTAGVSGTLVRGSNYGNSRATLSIYAM